MNIGERVQFNGPCQLHGTPAAHRAALTGDQRNNVAIGRPTWAHELHQEAPMQPVLQVLCMGGSLTSHAAIAAELS